MEGQKRQTAGEELGGAAGVSPTWVSVPHVHLVPTADAGGVQRVNAEGADLTAELLDVAVFAGQRHLELQTHLVLLCDQLDTEHNRDTAFKRLNSSGSNCSSDFVFDTSYAFIRFCPHNLIAMMNILSSS